MTTAAADLYREGVRRRAERDLAGAEAALRAVLEADPAHVGARFELGMTLLAQGRLKEGFDLYEWRALRRRRAPFMAANYAYPEWRGEPLAGKRLLVIGEQGFGDQILVARFLTRTGAAAVSYAGPPELERLLAPLVTDYIRTDTATERPQADRWLLSMSLPQRLGVDLEGLPAAPYLRAEAAPVAGRIGVAWRGAAYNPNDAYRTLPTDVVAGLLALPGAVSLLPEDTGAGDFQATAEMIAGLDLVISVDSAVAHLAGALGKPVWVLLGAHGLDWQWMAGRADSPWYPSARIFRQRAPGSWADVLAAVRAALA